MEGVLLNKLSWNLMFKTSADYLDLFLVQGMIFSNDTISENGQLYRKGKRSIDQDSAKKLKDYS